MSEEEVQQYLEQEIPFEYEDDWPGLDQKCSQNKEYNVYQIEQIVKKIYDDNRDKSDITSLPPLWNLMLYYFSQFNEQQLFSVIDQQNTGRRMIRFDEKYAPKIFVGPCMVCCNDLELVQNPCGHSFCYACWQNFLATNHCDRSNYQLFPMCPWEGCYFRTNYLLMNEVWERFPEEKKHFEKLLCLKYSQKSAKVKLCKHEGCNKAIVINLCNEKTLHCSCGGQICRICGENEHFPLDCGDLKTWNKIAGDKENQWLNEIVTQQCPMCKTPIDKNGGCIHMTCRCGHHFCWICLKVWKGHNNYGQCNSIKKQDHEKKLQEEFEKKKKDQGHYNIRFEEAKSQIERIEHIIKRVKGFEIDNIVMELNGYQILTKDLTRLGDFKKTLLDGLLFEKNAQVYIFFERQGHTYLKGQLHLLFEMLSKLDDYVLQRVNLADKVMKKLTVEKGNKKEAPQANIYLQEIKESYFKDWEFANQTYHQSRKILQHLLKGNFMSLQ